jgi:hypothetical protein
MLLAKPSRIIKVEKCPVNTMDVDEEPAALPSKKVNHSGKGVFAVSNVAESSSQIQEHPLPCPKALSARAPAEHASDPHCLSRSSSVGRPLMQPPPSAPCPKTRVVDFESVENEENLQIDNSFDFEINHAHCPEVKCTYKLHIKDTEEIRKAYKAVEARDPHRFCKTMETFTQEGFALSRTREWLLLFGEGMSDLFTFFNAIHLIFAAFQYHYRTLKLLDPLPSNPNHPIFFDARDPQPHWKWYTHNAFPPFNGERHISMGNYNNVWKEYKLALMKHEDSELEKEAAFMERQKSKFSEWEKRVKIPGPHHYQSQHIQEHEKVVCKLEMHLNTLSCFILYCLCTQFEDEDWALKGCFPPAASSKSEKPLSMKQPCHCHRHH